MNYKKLIKIIKIKNIFQNDYKNYNKSRIQDITSQLENVKFQYDNISHRMNYVIISNNKKIYDIDSKINSTFNNKYLHLKSPMKINTNIEDVKMDEYDFNKLLNNKKYD